MGQCVQKIKFICAILTRLSGILRPDGQVPVCLFVCFLLGVGGVGGRLIVLMNNKVFQLN